MAEQYFANKDKGMMASKKAVSKRLESLVKRRRERAMRRETQPLTLEQRNIRSQILEKYEQKMEEAKSPEQKKMEKQLLLALGAPEEMEMMAIEAPKKKGGRPPGGKTIQLTPEFASSFTLKQAKDIATKLKLPGRTQKKGESAEEYQRRIFKAYEEHQAKPSIRKYLTSSKMPKLVPSIEPVEEFESEESEESDDDPTVVAAKEVVAAATGVPEVAGKGLDVVGGGVGDFIKGLATKAIDHIKKDPIGAIKQAVSIGKSVYEHGTKAKEMYDKFFKGKAKGGMLAGFSEPEKRHLVHKIYHLNLFNKMMS